MSDFLSSVGRRQSSPLTSIQFTIASGLVILFFVLSPPSLAQSAAPSSAPSACPVQFLHFDPDGVSTRIKNVSGRKIVGLVFNAAVADATEHWKWLHWNFDDARPVQNFGWNKPIKAGETKKLSWDRVDLDFEHGGGGAFFFLACCLWMVRVGKRPTTRHRASMSGSTITKNSLLNQCNYLSDEERFRRARRRISLNFVSKSGS